MLIPTILITTDSLSYFFKEAGFDIEEAYFINKVGDRVHHDLSEEEMLKDLFAVGLVAPKPVEEKK